jgi:hypothetical protein
VVIALMFIVANLAADTANGRLDPRYREATR